MGFSLFQYVKYRLIDRSRFLAALASEAAICKIERKSLNTGKKGGTNKLDKRQIGRLVNKYSAQLFCGVHDRTKARLVSLAGRMLAGILSPESSGPMACNWGLDY